MTHLHTKLLQGVLGIAIFGSAVAPAHAQQLGILTSIVGSGELDGQAQDWLVGSSIDEGNRLRTDANSYAMIFFVSGLSARDIEFDGTIVVQMDQNTEIKVLAGAGAGRRKPIDVHVLRGRVLAHFDAGEHKDVILLSCPQGQLKVTGSKIYVAHDLPEQPGVSVMGTFDSKCRATLTNGDEFELSDFEKIVVTNGQGQVVGMVADDQDSWQPVTEALNLESAFAYNNQVRNAYVGRTWVKGYIASAERLEDVGDDNTPNIPSQEPEVNTAPTAVVTRVATPSPRQTQPALRASSGGRRVGDDDTGIGRETLNRQRLHRIRR